MHNIIVVIKKVVEVVVKKVFQISNVAIAISSAIAVGLAIAPQGAWAQDPDEQLTKIERIAVTGSNIKRVQNEDATPLQVIDEEDILRSGKVTITDVLRDLTVNTGNSSDEQATSSFTAGSASIALRGLSPKNTLVLVNGRRVSNYGFAYGTQDTFVDLNALPVSAVARVEVLKDGASAVYGSDAIAGVVNIILKKDYQGTEAHAGIGQATEGGLQQYRAGVVWGHGSLRDDHFNITASLDVLERDRLNADQRKITESGDFRDLPGGRLSGWATSGGNYLDGALPRAFEECPEGSEHIELNNFNPSYDGEVCGFNAQPYSTLQPKISRKQFSAQATYAPSQSFEAFAEVLYSYNDSSHVFGPPLTVGAGLRAYDRDTGTLVDIPVELPVGHPDNPTDAPLPFEYTFFDIGERLKSNRQIFNRVLVGARYEGAEWDWELTALQSQSRQREYVDNFVNRFVFEDVLASGEYDFFTGNNDQALVDSLRIDTRRPGEYELKAINLNTSGFIGQGKYGDYAVAIGVDWRQESMDAGTSEEVLSGTELRPAINLIKGSRDVIASYVEFDLPLYEDLIVNAATRYDKYSDFGHAFSPKVSAYYTLAEDWLFRVSWSKGFRAPSLPEIAQSNTISYGSAIDPLDPVAPGTSRGFTQIRSGNPDLKPEYSKNFNAGLVWSPSRGLFGAIDFFQIEQKNIIGSDSTQYLLNNQDLYADRIQRDSAGRLQIITNRYANQGTRKTAGFDFDLGYRKNIENGVLSLTTTWSRLLHYKQALVAGEAAINGAGNNQFGALPEWKGLTQFQAAFTNWHWTLGANYSAGYDQKRVTATSNPGLKPKVDAHLTYDAQVTYSGIDKTLVIFSVRNLTDKQPPFDPSAGSGYFNSSQYNARGRFVDLSIRYTL